jgi:hypothetical protein
MIDRSLAKTIIKVQPLQVRLADGSTTVLDRATTRLIQIGTQRFDVQFYVMTESVSPLEWNF